MEKGKRKRRRRYQVIGGPLCGSKVAKTHDGWLGLEDTNHQDEEHWYRLCVVQDSYGRRAKFWHYLGQEPVETEPWLFPSQRHFK